MTDRFSRITEEDGPLEPPVRPTISSRASSGHNSPRRELPGSYERPQIGGRSVSGFEGPTSLAREQSPVGMQRLARVPPEPLAQIQGARNGLRVTKRVENGFVNGNGNGIFADDQSDYSESPTEMSRSTSWTNSTTAGQNGVGATTAKKPPPPPPPSRSKKPPPAPPLKRSALSTSEVPGY